MQFAGRFSRLIPEGVRWTKLGLPLITPLLVSWVYQPINEHWTVEVFGCGCPGPSGLRRFNANDFNLILFSCIAIGCGVLWNIVFSRERAPIAPQQRWFIRLLAMSVILVLSTHSFAMSCWL